MVVVLIGAGAFVYWRVQYALDHRLNQDLQTQTSDLREAATDHLLRPRWRRFATKAREGQLVTRDGAVLTTGAEIAGGRPLLTPAQARQASRGELQSERVHLSSARGKHLRLLAVPCADPLGAVAVSAVRLDQRDEALRELLA
jgi:signal transduction histidine kinase